MSARREFTESEDNFIRSNYRTMPRRDIAEHLGRSEASITHRAYRLGVRKQVLRRWTEAEDQVIRNSAGRTLADIARELGRGETAVSERARAIGLGSWRRRNGYKPDADGRKVREYVRHSNGQMVRRMEHRAVMEEHLGRRLHRREIVHHIDCNKLNNRIGNLFLCPDAAEHQHVHRSIERIIPGLLERGIIRFNRISGGYELCETVK